MNKNVYDTKQAAKYLGIAYQTLLNWRHLRKGPNYRKLGRRVIYHGEDLDEFSNAGLIIVNQ